MKKVLYIAFVIAFVLTMTFSLSACNNNVSSDKLLYRNWAENKTETFTYDVSDNTGVVGTMTQSVKPIEGGFQIVINQSMNNGDTVSGTVQFKNAASSGSAFLPTSSTRISTVGGVKTTQTVLYDGGVHYYTWTGETVKYEDGKYYTASDNSLVPPTYETSVSAPYYDNMQFYTVIRGASFNNKFSLSFNVFVPNESKVVKLACSLGSTDNVNYKLAGVAETQSVGCQLVNIARSQSIAGEAIKAYYATSDITVGDYKVKQALVKFVEGNYSYSLTNVTVA